MLSGNFDLNRPIFCLCPGSVNSDAKRWPGDYFADLADLLIENGGQVVFLGAPEEYNLIRNDSIAHAKSGIYEPDENL